MWLNYGTDMAVFWVCIMLFWWIVPGYGRNILLSSSALKMGAVKCWYLPTKLHGVITQKITIWIFISIKTTQLHINCDHIVTANSQLNTDTKVDLGFSFQQGQKLCSPHHPDQSWGTPNLLSSDAGESHPPPLGRKALKLTTYLHLVLKLRMCGTLLHCPHISTCPWTSAVSSCSFGLIAVWEWHSTIAGYHPRVNGT
jgi:hypothetical protein